MISTRRILEPATGFRCTASPCCRGRCNDSDLACAFWTGRDVDVKSPLHQLQEQVRKELALKHSRLSGNEIKFIRQFSKMTFEQFAERFDVTHPGVLKWERTKNHGTAMSWWLSSIAFSVK